MSNECGSFDHCGCKDKVAKLQAVVDMTREILVEAEDYEKRTGKTISWLNKLRDAIKEVDDE